MSELLQKQHRFSRMVADLLVAARLHGYEVSIGEVWRPQEMADIYAARGTGSKRSLHINKLAIDIHLFLDGVYLKTAKDYEFLGNLWKSWGGAWGGDFDLNGDGKKGDDPWHFSLPYGGIR